MKTFWIVLIVINSFCIGVNVIVGNYWIIPINLAAIIGCIVNLRG